MPIYEEKLISPLALKFTQEHIRTTFRDGRVVEDTVREILAEPCTCSSSYDLVLRAPFPTIEIVRYRPPSSGQRSSHWFTLDNRRLYCLQRAAVAHWPLRVAVVVDMLYADSGHAWKKLDTTTCGDSVTIAASCRRAPTCRWDWRKACAETILAGAAVAALQAVDADNAKERIDELEGAAEEPNAVMRLMGALTAGKLASSPVPGGSETPSTTSQSSDESVKQKRGSFQARAANKGANRRRFAQGYPGVSHGAAWNNNQVRQPLKPGLVA